MFSQAPVKKQKKSRYLICQNRDFQHLALYSNADVTGHWADRGCRTWKLALPVVAGLQISPEHVHCGSMSWFRTPDGNQVWTGMPKNGGFLSHGGTPKSFFIILFSRIFHNKPTIFGNPQFLKPSYICYLFI